MAKINQNHTTMSILLKILLGLLILLAILVVGVFVTYFIIVARHERRWRQNLSDKYEMYSDGNERKNDD